MKLQFWEKWSHGEVQNTISLSLIDRPHKGPGKQLGEVILRLVLRASHLTHLFFACVIKHLPESRHCIGSNRTLSEEEKATTPVNSWVTSGI